MAAASQKAGILSRHLGRFGPMLSGQYLLQGLLYDPRSTRRSCFLAGACLALFVGLMVPSGAWAQGSTEPSKTTLDVQWAAELVGFSTQFGRQSHAAEQVLGAPDAWPRTGESAVAWAPSRPDASMDEFLRVRFASPMVIQQVLVAESLNPGAIVRILAYDENGKKHELYRDMSETVPFWPEARMFRHVLDAPTSFRVAEIKLFLRTRRIGGMVQIDAIGIADHTESIRPAVRSIDDELFDEPAENLGPLVNSRIADQLPLISPDGRTLYYARKLHPRNAGDALRDDIWVAEQGLDGVWNEPQNVGRPLNNEHHNFVSWISPDGQHMLLPHDYDRVELGRAFRVSMSHRRSDGTWSLPQTQAVRDLYNKNEFTCLHMNAEGTVMLLALERDGGMGGLDLYAAFHEGGKRWSAPLHLGPTINTAGMEGSLFLAADGRSLYFSSNGLPGYGGYDMYLSRRLDDTWTAWSEPINLGERINGPGDDYYYTLPASGEYAYFASEKIGGQGQSDLYRIRLPRMARPDPVNYLEARVLSSDREEPLPARLITARAVWPVDSAEGRGVLVAARDTAQSAIVVAARGHFPVLLDLERRPPPDKVWMDYLESEPVPIAASKPVPTAVDSIYRTVSADIRLVPLAVGNKVTLRGVFFAANKATLRWESRTELDVVAQFLREHPGLRVEIGGHTNGLPGTAFCQDLSDARAKRVLAYLIEHGVDRGQLAWRGYGKTEPLADNETLEGRQKNQRVELTILSVNP